MRLQEIFQVVQRAKEIIGLSWKCPNPRPLFKDPKILPRIIK